MAEQNTSALDLVKTASSLIDLRITDMRIAVVGGGGWRWPIIKLETNQGLVGIGEVRDGASARYAMMLQSRLLGANTFDSYRRYTTLTSSGVHGQPVGAAGGGGAWGGVADAVVGGFGRRVGVVRGAPDSVGAGF